jgi:hypothetical protein
MAVYFKFQVATQYTAAFQLGPKLGRLDILETDMNNLTVKSLTAMIGVATFVAVSAPSAFAQSRDTGSMMSYSYDNNGGKNWGSADATPSAGISAPTRHVKVTHVSRQLTAQSVRSTQR